MNSVSAVIPVKQLTDAKQRLSPVLSAQERNNLFTVMVEDVLTAVEACVLIDEVVVVTNDETVVHLASGYNARILPEPRQPGLISAVTSAARDLEDKGVAGMVFLPGDIPLVTADELEIVLDGFATGLAAEFLIVPANDLGGSNCIACAPPTVMNFAFGEDSFRKHLVIARELQLHPGVIKLPGIGLDVDTPDDLKQLVQTLANQEDDSHTYRYLRESGILVNMLQQTEGIGK